MITFNTIPNTIRTPGVYAELDNSRSVGGLVQRKPRALVLGLGSDDGTSSELVVKAITRDGQADGFFGPGTELARMCNKFRDNNRDVDLYAMRVSATAGAFAATASIRFSVGMGTNSMTQYGTVHLMVNGVALPVTLSPAWSAVDAASMTVDLLQLSQNARLPVRASLVAASAVVLLSEVTVGAAGGAFPVLLNYQEGQTTPDDFVSEEFIDQLAGGGGSSDFTNAWAVIAPEDYDYFVVAAQDQESRAAVIEEMESRANRLSSDVIPIAVVPVVEEVRAIRAGSGGWIQVAPQEDGQTHVRSLVVYNGSLYGGTSAGGRLFRWNDVNAWVEVAPQLDLQANIYSLAVYDGRLYGGTGNGGRLFRWNDVDAWVEVAPQAAGQTRIHSLAVYNGQLYGGTEDGGYLLRWNGADAWAQVAPTAGAQLSVPSLAVYNGQLYGGTSPDAKLFRWNDVDAWVELAPQLDGQALIHSLVVYNGQLYGGTGTGGRLFRWNGVDAWVEVAPQLDGQANIRSLVVYNGQLYGSTGATGRLFRWNGANAWEQVAAQEGGQTNIHSLAPFNNKLYAGTEDGGRLFEFYTPTVGTTVHENMNSPYTVAVSCPKHAMPTDPKEVAAAVGAVASRNLSIDPARPLHFLPLNGVLPPKNKLDLPLRQERDRHYYTGRVPLIVLPGGRVGLERVVTTYRVNALGLADPSYLDVQTIATLSEIRYQFRARMANRFIIPRYKLVGDETPISAGAMTASPRTIRAEIMSVMELLYQRGLVENLQDFAENLIVERNTTDPTRVDVVAPPDLINQFMCLASRIQFIL